MCSSVNGKNLRNIEYNLFLVGTITAGACENEVRWGERKT